MNHDTFMQICRAYGYPSRGWQKRMVETANSLAGQGACQSINQSTISQTINDEHKSITPRTARTMRALADAHASGDIPTLDQSKDAAKGAVVVSATYTDPDDKLSNEELLEDIRDRFTTFEECVKEVVCGSRHSVVVSGPPGAGKSHTVNMYADHANGVYKPITGDVSGIGLYKALVACKDNGVLVFDDCDGVFADEVKLNLLKGATECKPPGHPRMISWLKETKALDDDGDPIPRTIDFQGRILFMTNVDFDREIQKGGKLAPHLSALLDRSGYLSLGLHSKRRRMLRIVQICTDTEIMKDNGIEDPEAQAEILDFVQENQDKWRHLNLRLIVNLCSYRKTLPSKWQKHAKALLMNPKR